MATTTISAPGVPAVKYNLAVGYLRAFLVVLVVAHHAVLAYHPFAPPAPVSLVAQPRWWEAFPITDPRHWSGFALLVGFNDTFFMSLMFLVSGLFVWHGLQSKGAARFLRGRLLRLGLPFAVAAAFLAPLAYYPAYLQSTAHAGFWKEWLALGQWPAGPAWFIWVLLVFDGIAALMFKVAPRAFAGLGRRPLLILAISGIVYIAMALYFTPGDWTSVGPFSFQTSRIFHYLAYFLIGAGLGALGVDRGLLAPDGRLARRWRVWAIAAFLVFAATSVVAIVALTGHPQSQAWGAAMDLGFVLSCASWSFAFLALFLRFARSRSPIFDSLAANSYGIYLFHYAFVSWLQYALLPASLPGIAKGAIVFVLALGLSWGTAAALRRSPAVARVV
jgi:peptidoglycan/LPS O-acetylase OafA/YrhL